MAFNDNFMQTKMLFLGICSWEIHADSIPNSQSIIREYPIKLLLLLQYSSCWEPGVQETESEPKWSIVKSESERACKNLSNKNHIKQLLS